MFSHWLYVSFSMDFVLVLLFIFRGIEVLETTDSIVVSMGLI